MIPTIKKILYATDLSRNSAYAFRYAMNSALKHDAKITILHVIEEMSPSAEAVVKLHIGEAEHEKIIRGAIAQSVSGIKKRIQIFCDREMEGRPECFYKVDDIEVCEGYPADEILRRAYEEGFDLIIMGSHGRGTLSHSFLGSTAERVLRRTRTPIYIIPLPKGNIDISLPDI